MLLQLIYNVLLFVLHCTGVCPQGDVRLVDGPDDDNQWGTVCDDSWGEKEKDAIVVCTQLEYTGAHVHTQKLLRKLIFSAI